MKVKCIAGRTITVDGKPFVSIHKEEGASPVEADALAQFLAKPRRWAAFRKYLEKYKKS